MRTALHIHFILVDPNEILTIAGENPDRHWKTTVYKKSGQLRRLEIEQIKLFSIFDRLLAEVKSHLAQNKTVYAERAYQCFFETYGDLEIKRQQHRQLLKPKFLQSFDADTDLKLGE